jgi:aryl-alcohol dehydrogenase-like predicted oxidoreductase
MTEDAERDTRDTPTAIAIARESHRRSILTAAAAGACWLGFAGLAYQVAGGAMAALYEGIDRERIWQTSPAALGLLIAALGIACLATYRWARTRPATSAPNATRRAWLIGASGTALGIGSALLATYARVWGWRNVSNPVVMGPGVPRTGAVPLREWDGARVESYRRLGRTDFKVSDISLGSGAIAGTPLGEAIARAALERGVNYFDTAPDYAETGTESTLGRVMRGVRDRMFLATKFCNKRGHLPAGSSVGEYMSAVEGSLGRLQTDYVDLVHIHACDSTERLMDENLHEAFDRLKEQGKARFLGFSSHTPNLIEVAGRAIDSDRFDVMMLAYHHGAWPELGSLIERAAAADIGVVAMKTLKGAKHRGMADFVAHGDAYSQAAFRWVLSNRSVSCLVISFYLLEHVDEYLYASGKTLTPADTALLEDYDRAIAGSYCLPHCGACLSHCPEGVPIPDVLRHRMYFEDYGLEKLAMQQYARLDKRADACAGCPAPCLSACPVGLPIAERTREAHALLTLG